MEEVSDILKIVRSDVCTRCNCIIFELIKVDGHDYWVRCLKCGIQIISRKIKNLDVNSFDDISLINKYINNIYVLLNNEMEKDRQLQFEIDEKNRQLQLEIDEKNRKRKEIEKLFDSNFLGSRQIWLKKLSNWMNETEFIELSTQFVAKWFEKQCWRVPDQEQALCIANVWDDVQVIARAGSGKTSTIVNRAAFLVKQCRVSPAEILLLAFNKEAAKEVNDKLHKMLGENKPQTMTFHALAYALVHPEEALIFDDEINGFSKSSTTQEVIDAFLRDPIWSEKIKEIMLKYFRADWERIESRGYHLKPEEMVEYRRLIPYIGLDGKYYKSIGEKRLADFLFEYDVPYMYEKNMWWDGLNYKPDFTIPLNDQFHKGIVIEYFGLFGDSKYDEQTRKKQSFWKNKSDYRFIELFPGQADTIEIIEQNIGLLLSDCGFKMRRLSDLEIWHRIKNRAIDEFSLTVSQFIGRCRKGLISPEGLADKIINQLTSLSELQVDFLKVVWKIYKEYLRMLSTNNEEDFDGLLIRAEEIIKHGQYCWRRKAGSGDLRLIKYLFIDEYQDFSLLFYRLVSVIREINQDIKVFCVGDDWQAINEFAGSDLRFFKEFNDYFPGAKKLTISSNYRSYKDIIKISNKLMDGEGTPARGVLTDLGKVYIANIDEFIPDDLEKEKYGGDCITPALIRVVNSYIEKGQRVALLCRRRGGVPWYTPYTHVKGKFHDQFISTIKKAFPEDQKSMVVAMNTVHSYKGKEEDVIIVVDAVSSSYPLIHPRYIFFEVLGHTKDEIISEEKRLFYVALSRAKKALVIFTEKGIESPFLKYNINSSLSLQTMNINSLLPPKREGTHYEVSIFIKGYQNNITSEIKSNGYRWNPAKKVWGKHFSAEEFSKERLLDESWAKNANNISVSVSDEFDNRILLIDIEDGTMNTKMFEKTRMAPNNSKNITQY